MSGKRLLPLKAIAVFLGESGPCQHREIPFTIRFERAVRPNRQLLGKIRFKRRLTT
jgi:hypothetical protein